MAAPPITARVHPVGDRNQDGFSSVIALQNKPDIQLWELATGGVKPPGYDGGEAIPTTTMHNLQFRTMRARRLLTVGPTTFKCLYDPDVINDVKRQINLEQGITFHYSTGDSDSYWGYLQKFEPGPCEEGKAPEADVTFIITNWDPVNNVEAGPLYTPATGT